MKNKGVWVILLHSIVILGAYSSPFWLNWKLVVLGVVIYYLQLIIFGWCVLSLKQFGEKTSFHEWYLGKLGIHPNPQKLQFVLNFIIPPLLCIVAIIVQR